MMRMVISPTMQVSGTLFCECDKTLNRRRMPAKRKTRSYEVPLSAVRYLREALNSMLEGQEIPEDALEKYDAPILAAAVKLWLLKLELPLGLYDTWDEFRKIYLSSQSTYRTEIYGLLTLFGSTRRLNDHRNNLLGPSLRRC